MGGVDSVLILDREVEERIEEGVGEQVGDEAELDELGVLRVVVVFFGFHPGVRDRHGSNVEPELRSGSRDELRELVDGELLGELVEDPELAWFGWVGDRELDALNCVSDI